MKEGMSVTSEPSTNIFVNAGMRKTCSNSAVIQIQSNEKSTPQDLGLHINTTLSIASSMKIKILFLLNFLLSIVCIVISCSIVIYYWNEMIYLRKQLDLIKEQLAQHPNPVNVYSPSQEKLVWKKEMETQTSLHPASKRYYVDGLEQDLHFTNSKNKETDASQVAADVRQDVVVGHFVGGGMERFLGDDAIIGPWTADYNASSRNAALHFELVDGKLVKLHESGLYLIYAQVVYSTNSAKYFTMWAKDNTNRSRLLTMCSSGDVSAKRILRNSQLSCAVQTVARLNAGDVINFAQREKNTTVSLRLGESYFGFIKLSS